jgi:polar amino acid transport system substrate-binding protein
MARVVFLLTFAVFLFILPIFPVNSDDVTKLKVVFTHWYPYTYKEQTEKGFEIDIFKAVMKIMGIKAQFRQFPFERCLKMVEKGNADVIISLLKTPYRAQYIIFPDEYVSISKNLFFVKAGDKIKYRGSLKSLEKYTIGVVAGFSYGNEFDGADYLRKESVPDTGRLINMVVSGRYDLGIENHVILKTAAKKLGLIRSIRLLYPPVHSNKLYVGFSKISRFEKLAADFSDALRQFKTTQEYKSILRNYGISYTDMIHKSDYRSED